MEKRQLGKTDMEVSILGFGGAEIGYEDTNAKTVARLLNSALDAGLNVIDTAECYQSSEGLIGQAVSDRRNEFCLSQKSDTRVEWGAKIGRPAPSLRASNVACAGSGPTGSISSSSTTDRSRSAKRRSDRRITDCAGARLPALSRSHWR